MEFGDSMRDALSDLAFAEGASFKDNTNDKGPGLVVNFLNGWSVSVISNWSGQQGRCGHELDETWELLIYTNTGPESDEGPYGWLFEEKVLEWVLEIGEREVVASRG